MPEVVEVYAHSDRAVEGERGEVNHRYGIVEAAHAVVLRVSHIELAACYYHFFGDEAYAHGAFGL